MGLAQGGGVAQQFGAHIEDTVGTLAMFDQNALRGSDAGTSMKTMLLSLANPSKDAASAMEDLGIHAFTASGEFVGLAGLQDQLKEKTKNLTTEQREQAFATIFGSDAVRAANAPAAIESGDSGVVSRTGSVAPARAWTSTVENVPGTIVATVHGSARMSTTAADADGLGDGV